MAASIEAGVRQAGNESGIGCGGIGAEGLFGCENLAKKRTIAPLSAMPRLVAVCWRSCRNAAQMKASVIVSWLRNG